MARRRLSKRVVDSVAPGARVWDGELPGFGIRCRGSGAKYYVLKYRTRAGRQRWYTIGRHAAPWTPETARREARRLLGEVAAGLDPATAREKIKQDLTVERLCDLYQREGCATKKPLTLVTDRGRIERHIKPLLGRRSVRSVEKQDVERFMQAVAAGKTAKKRPGKQGGTITGGKGAASKSVLLLAAIYAFATERGIADHNPARGVKRYKDNKNERFLSTAELAQLGGALAEAEKEGVNATAIAAIKMLVLTGCRKSEILKLQWEDVDPTRSCLRLKDSKSGAKVVPLGAPACQLLDGLPRVAGNPYVFPGHKRCHHLVGLQRIWEGIRRRANLSGLRLHDLRHSFASVAAAGGSSLVIIGAILGHRNQSTTQRYAHLTDDPVKSAADRTASAVAAALEGREPNAPVRLTRA